MADANNGSKCRVHVPWDARLTGTPASHACPRCGDRCEGGTKFVRARGLEDGHGTVCSDRYIQELTIDVALHKVRSIDILAWEGRAS